MQLLSQKSTLYIQGGIKKEFLEVIYMTILGCATFRSNEKILQSQDESKNQNNTFEQSKNRVLENNFCLFVGSLIFATEYILI